jgi:hypothetical protein
MVEQIVQIALCTVVVVVFAVDRFQTPPSDPRTALVTYRISRSTTTAASYYTAVSLYGAIALGVFAFLLFSPRALDRLLASAPAGMPVSIPAWARESPSLVVVLILTVLLPKIPVLSGMDEWIRRRLQRMAAIPHEVRRLSAQLRRAPFRADGARRDEVRRALEAKDFDPTDVRFEEGSAPHYLWAKLSLLMRELDGWDADPKLIGYVLTYPNEFNSLRQRYERLLLRARRCFGLLRDLATDPEHARKGGAVYAYRDDFTQEVEVLLRDVYEAISNAVLLCELTHGARVRQLIRLGFDLDPGPPRRLTLNELLGLFTGVTVVCAFGFVVSRRLGEPGLRLDPSLFVLALVIAAVYCIAVWCAIYPKTRWVVARRRPEHGRPWGWYLLSGLMATAAGALVGYAAQLIWHGGRIADSWVAYREVGPWGLMTFTTAYVLALLADDEPGDGWLGLRTADRLRWVEGVALTVAMAATAWLVDGWLQSQRDESRAVDAGVQAVRPFLEAEILTVVIGFAIGSLVPSWYRTAPFEPPREEPTPEPAAEAGARD